MSKMILIIPSRYPTIYQPHNYIFVKDQAEILTEKYNVKVRGVITISFKELMKKGIFSLGVVQHNENNVDTKLILIPSLPKLKRFNNFIRNLGNYLLVKDMIKDIDIVHIHSYLAGDVGIKIKNKFNKDYFITEHSSNLLLDNLNNFDYDLANNVFLNSKKTFAVSEFFAKKLNKKFDKKIDILHNVIDTDFFKPKDLKKENFIFITIGNLVKVKNHELLINSFSKAFGKINNVELHIIGHGKEYENLQELINNNMMNQQIKLLGYKNKNEIKSCLNKASTFIMTSIHETFCIAIIEAMSMNLPIISTDFGGVISKIKDLDDCQITNNTVEDISQQMIYNYKNNIYRSNTNRNYIIKVFSKIVFFKYFKGKLNV